MATSSLEKVFPPDPAAGLPTAAFEERAEEDEDGIVEMSSEQRRENSRRLEDLKRRTASITRRRDEARKMVSCRYLPGSPVRCEARGGGARLRRGTPE